ncbi:2-oxoglutarate-dependent ethylene/succinate-forming enzyme [Metarhizium album ARSEF 1941]|uniref:2-oxoglutarate-dependent ethylene/succinate-forming enzyme n=1 Tax=Metarhizium album (strain ARSEF 1941) TaxID=1081103 RepID=A0A0B2WM02_METAS|nr:2-oxoglutarate-dependent ethylene/succinate-forming enzyme [Metarhizium album ARSEF 1941]KHN94689.1 2-oxoglutarate-dependent ethylene/succinate-forming enzyme [Metarhizium album ARSEF 1941]
MASLAADAVRTGAPLIPRTVRSLPTTFSAARAGNSIQSHRTMPPGFSATVGHLETFVLPERLSTSPSDKALAKAMVDAWRRHGILQIAMSPSQQRIYAQANAASREFFGKTPTQKQACVNESSYAGYVASGEEITGGIADYSEIFTVTKDLLPNDPRVMEKWPCHGPCPWPDKQMKDPMANYMADMGSSGDKLLRLVELGLDVPRGSLIKYTQDGWHHMRVLRFPASHRTNGEGKAGRGIGSHTDYGLLVIASQDEVGGLFVRPPRQGETFANWRQGAAGLKEDEAGWMYVPPTPGVFTAFPGDMMQYMTNSFLQSTPHKVGLNVRERFAFAYFHEPNFRAVVKPLPGYNGAQEPADDCLITQSKSFMMDVENVYPIELRHTGHVVTPFLHISVLEEPDQMSATSSSK